MQDARARLPASQRHGQCVARERPIERMTHRPISVLPDAPSRCALSRLDADLKVVRGEVPSKGGFASSTMEGER